MIITGIGGVAGPAVAGGCLGVLFLAPLRRYFVRDMHGRLPYPKATAIAGVYDFFVTTFQVWKEYLDFRFIPAMQSLEARAKVVFNFEAVGFILGLGSAMGLRSSLILCAGGALSNFVLAPLIWVIGSHLPDLAVYPAQLPIAKMSAGRIFRGYVRFTGVGAIATAGIFGIIKSLRLVAGSFAMALRACRHGAGVGLERTGRDISVMTVLLGMRGAALFEGWPTTPS